MTVGFALIVAASLAAGPDPAVTAKATYFLGESHVSSPDGRSLGNLVLLVKREQFPAQSKIVETMLIVSSNPREPATEYVSVFVVEGSSFRVKEQGNAFTGRGELTGKPWNWTSWLTSAQTPGGTLHSRTETTDRGLTVVKTLVGPDGVPRMKYVEDHAVIDGGTYELFHAKLYTKSPK